MKRENFAHRHVSFLSSLLFSGMLLTRLTVPLGLNFLSMTHLDTHVTSGNIITQVRRDWKQPNGRRPHPRFSLMFIADGVYAGHGPCGRRVVFAGVFYALPDGDAACGAGHAVQHWRPPHGALWMEQLCARGRRYCGRSVEETTIYFLFPGTHILSYCP